jgi:hypothetical protein
MELTDAPFNEPVLGHLRSQATPGHDDSWDLQGWELHVHPDLSERFAQLAPSGMDLIPAYGIHVLAARGVAAGFVQGTSCMFLRLPIEPSEIAQSPNSAAIFAAPDWYAVDPWQSHVLTEVGLGMLRTLIKTAYQFALTFT